MMILLKNIKQKMNECPSNDYLKGCPSGKCWGCGHYLCYECANLDRRINAETYENLMAAQGGLQIIIVNKK